MVEGDALTVIKKVNYSEKDKSTISALTKECKERVSRFEAADFGYVPRQANEATHGLAKEGRRYESSMY
ncbi:hypothetical protein Goari_018405 [Gossypium aridum]|uniref:RNase H type-1 domain-containing protein n=1 Tax=Gossypium aridum TaxID=34290 RepID=A0A7J8WPY7_GOSAI|nr:hypothetical protein [Gossypium aridum]